MPVGVCVITGFLGSGKTTLVNYILKADHGYRIAVILNDFGAELGVEKMLVQQDGVDGDNASRTLVEDWVELNNGCVCCTVKGSLVQTIEGLLEKRKEMGEKFDFILLETTGLADPGPVARELWVDDELVEEDGAVLDSIVTLVDASNIEKQIEENKEATLQVAYADTILLNKADLVKAEDLERVKARIAAINAEAEIVVTTRSSVDLGIVLNQGTVAGGGRGRKPVLGEFASAPPSAVVASGAVSGPRVWKSTHLRRAYTIQTSEPCASPRVGSWMANPFKTGSKTCCGNDETTRAARTFYAPKVSFTPQDRTSAECYKRFAKCTKSRTGPSKRTRTK